MNKERFSPANVYAVITMHESVKPSFMQSISLPKKDDQKYCRLVKTADYTNIIDRGFIE
jgi:hypothetical protein